MELILTEPLFLTETETVMQLASWIDLLLWVTNW
jgi:hypothetical protein